MSQIKFSPQANEDLGRFADFLVKVGVSHKAEATLSHIFAAFELLIENPLAGKPYPLANYYNFRELVINYGKNGYVALYSFDKTTDLVVIHAIRHQKEVGYNV